MSKQQKRNPCSVSLSLSPCLSLFLSLSQKDRQAKKAYGNAGFRSRCLAHAKRALCQLSYAPDVHLTITTVYVS